MGVTPLTYRVIYTNLQNGGAMAECTFEITIEGKDCFHFLSVSSGLKINEVAKVLILIKIVNK